MLQIVFASTSLILLFSLIGYPLAQLILGNNNDERFLRLPTLISLSLLMGFFVSAFSATFSYGLIGIDSYLGVLLTISFASWIGYFLYIRRNSQKLLRISAKRSDFSILLIVIWCLVLTRSQWETFTKPRLVSGDGPDTSQNLMTALSARSLGNTWSEQAEKINSFFGHETLRQSVFDLYRYPSFRDQAGFDYLVYGTRWGLSVPYSQILRFFGDKAILWETGIVITTSLIVLGIMVYGISSYLNANRYISLAAALISVSNSLLLVQYFNGGLSQVWSISGILGISLSLILIVNKKEQEKSLSNKGLVALSVASWTILISTYVDAAVILGLLGFVAAIVFLPIQKQISYEILKHFLVSGLITLALNPVLTYATTLTFDLRLQAATATGLATQFWNFPSEIFGFIDVFSSTDGPRSFETMFMGILITFSILFTLIKKLKDGQRTYLLGYLSLSAFLVMFIGFILSFTGELKTNYIYNKVSIYVTPLILILWLSSFNVPHGEEKPGLKTKKSSSGGRQLPKVTFALSLLILTSIPMASSVSATKTLSAQGTTIPYEFAPMLENGNLQKRLATYNYLTPYILSANFLGVIGNVHWVSKAPNDIKLESRESNEMRLICYSVDTNCKPTTKRISDPELEKYALIQYESPVSSKDFSRLSPRDRYRVNFEVFGIPPQTIPERFIGGNPYYN